MRRVILLTFIFLILLLGYAYSENMELKDVSSINLNSLTVDNSARFSHLRLLIKVNKAGNPEAVIDIKKAVQKSLEYLFIGLTIPDDKFWVNLNPDEPSRIIDTALGNTDLGRIMLNADLKLKKDISEIINPRTSSIGKEFWSRLYAKAEALGIIDEIPVMTRLWIVPDQVIVSETGNKFSIVKTKLKVCLESAYLSQYIQMQDKRQKEIQDYAFALMEELALPFLNNKVNKDYSYAGLREVYRALILARCYRDKFSYQRNSLLRTVNASILEDTEIDLQYAPDEIYRDYLKSLKDGEYSFTETNTSGFSFYQMAVTKHYFSGGVDFRNIKIAKIDKPLSAEGDKDNSYFTCELYLPQDIERPLQYAKSQLELTAGNSLQDRSPISVVKNLPAIVPVRFAEVGVQSLNSIDRTERLLLSKL